LTNEARHVGPKVNGKRYSEIKRFRKAVDPADFNKFVEIYDRAMRKQKLLNYKHKMGFLPNSTDPFHVELNTPRPSEKDPAVKKCLMTYAKATREGGKRRNEKMERESPSAKRFLADYDKEHGSDRKEAKGNRVGDSK
jgi:hypothetical protein